MWLINMKGVQFPVASVLLVLACSLAIASDPSRLQDFCVAINDFKIKTCGVYRFSLYQWENDQNLPIVLVDLLFFSLRFKTH